MEQDPSTPHTPLVSHLVALFLIVIVSVSADASNELGTPMCAIDMGSNSFRQIVGSFENGRYEQRIIAKRTLGVGDDVARHGGISDRKLAEIKEVLAAFKTSC